MGDAPSTPSTVSGSDAESVGPPLPSTIGLQSLPPIYVISTNLSPERLRRIEDALYKSGARLTFDEKEAQIFLGKVQMKKRAAFELRKLGVWTEPSAILSPSEQGTGERGQPARKKQKWNDNVHNAASDKIEVVEVDSNTESEGDEKGDTSANFGAMSSHEQPPDSTLKWPNNAAVVVKLSWLNDSLDIGKPLPLSKYVLYEGKRITKPSSPSFEPTSPSVPSKRAVSPNTRAKDILSRARADENSEPKSNTGPFSRFRDRRAGSPAQKRRVPLLHRSTTDEEAVANIIGTGNQPDWVKNGSTFSCERITPLHGPNEAFVDQLKLIRTARKLTNDKIGVRAYSTSIAAIAAYPTTITSRLEVLALPGCDAKIGALWAEWHEQDGVISTVEDIENDEKMRVMRLFYDIWGVGALTAQDYYYRGWRDLDDIVEYGWSTLPRVVQIGVKFYDEFLLRIPRDESIFIESVIIDHLKRVREPEGVRTCIVGGYRRGKEDSGDVDVIISHTTEHATMNLVEDVVQSLIEEGWVTHELITYASGTRREQNALQFRQDGGGHGFDTLDKALCVWHNPNLSDSEDNEDESSNAESDENEKSSEKYRNPHRRVDIICATWSRIGCAVLGWSADTTFERDLRRFAKYKKGWKFDSSGVRSRATGREIDVQGPCDTVEEAERKVFESFGLGWREPWERCTG